MASYAEAVVPCAPNGRQPLSAAYRRSRALRMRAALGKPYP
jgi:hypothetical protein